MKGYIGTKIIAAKEMNRGDYNKYRGWNGKGMYLYLVYGTLVD